MFGFAVGVVLFLLPNVPIGSPGQDEFSPDQKQIVNAMNTLFAAARTEDVARFNSTIAPGFYIFDGGSRFTGEALLDLLKSSMPRENIMNGT